MKVNNSTVSKVYEECNSLLKCDSIWNSNQALLYSSLKVLLKEQALSKKLYKLNKDHHEKYIKFIKEQDWYIGDSDRIYIDTIVNTFLLYDPIVCNDKGIKCVFFIKNTMSYLTIFYDKLLNVFYVYFSKNNAKAFVCYYNGHDKIKMQKELRLPQFESIYEVSGFSDSMFKKSSLVKFIVDSLKFYGLEELIFLNIGINYPVNLNSIYNNT
jgi:hypothetical protein